MTNLRKTVAALGFVCFFSLALLPVSMTVCGPVTSRLIHHAKRLHHATRDMSPRFVGVQPHGTALERDIILEDSVRSVYEHTGIARNPAGREPESPEIYTNQGFVQSARVSTFDLHTVLIL